MGKTVSCDLHVREVVILHEATQKSEIRIGPIFSPIPVRTEPEWPLRHRKPDRFHRTRHPYVLAIF